ncbi:Amino acid transporter, transmembrane domain [Sesbania bispinosa]|nr:Amino acid transporter, transmembrane domain [Sesbania bispinosa]
MTKHSPNKKNQQSLEISSFHQGSECYDDDGHPKRTGTVWTASSHIITAVIGSGVLSLAWAIAQLGWIAGPIAMFLFSTVTYYTSTLLSDCYRCGDLVSGKRNYTYMDALKSILDFHDLWWLSALAAAMSFTYSIIGLALGVSKVAVILIEIQDTIKSPPSEAKTMKKATFISVVVTTVFYMLCGCFGYAAFGDSSPGNLLTGFGLFNPFWLLDIANVAIVVHLVGAYQVYCQPLFSFVEKFTADRFPDSNFVNKDIEVPIPGAAGSIAGIIVDLQTYKPFHTSY